MSDLPPVVAIDGPSASGKGTIAQRVAQALGFHYLDSGALYRLVGLAALRSGVALDDEASLASLARGLDIVFLDSTIRLGRDDVTQALRTEACSDAASRAAPHGAVRATLLQRQRDFRRAPGLVADGRDMGSVVFPDATLKIYLDASAEVRAQRRTKQLIEKGLDANLADILQDLRERDARDFGRSAAPLRIAAGASVLDSTALGVDEVVTQVLERFNSLQTQSQRS